MGATSQVTPPSCNYQNNTDSTQRTTYRGADNNTRDWESAIRKTRPEGSLIDGVGIVAILEKPTGPEIVLQKQFRPPVDKICIEVPAGLIDPNESSETCALRELKEETGYIGKVVQGGFAQTPIFFNGRSSKIYTVKK